MIDVVLAGPADRPVIPVHPIRQQDWPSFAESASQTTRAAASLTAFAAKAGDLALVPTAEGAVERVLFGLGERAGGAMAPPAMIWRGLAARLPAGDYQIADGEASSASVRTEDVALAWALGTYRFDRYKQERGAPAPRLVAPAGADLARVRALAGACALARDMVNTPASDMGPLQIETIAREIAEAHGASLAVVVGDDLIEAGYPAVHAVGRAAAPARAPRMIELTWGEAERPRVALVGKGVVFDTGGLDIKPSAGMRLMKKDMGGAAHALALGRMIMALNLPVRLTVLVPAVENAISGDAMRPGDVLASRKGLSIEVGNTDAEGRLILADALTRAAELEPDLTIDLATLTGAARVALGPQVIPFYTADEDLAAALAGAARAVEDPLWRMPLWEGYAAALDSDVADLKNDPDAWAQAGSVTAALFLQRFAPQKTAQGGAWAHFDIFAWNPRARPGWPAGAEVQAIRAILAVLEARYR
ncbi:MAG TPA: leucyl aminopeptidase family protein [Caulobacteraceae bacterium]|nr:leucyl aminopeptidase family protein [Caulobacteraceae bacterium]